MQRQGKKSSAVRRGALALAMLAALAIVPIAATAVEAEPPGAERADGANAQRAANARLRGFGSCAAFHRYARRHQEAISYPVGVAEDGVGGPVTAAPGEAGGAATGADSAGGGSTATPTNVQETGIDEPDIVKSDGSRVFAIAGAKLRAIDITGEAPRQVGSIDLTELGGEESYGYGDEILLAGDRLLLINESYGSVSGGGGGSGVAADIAIYPYEPRTILHEIDISDPAAMRLVRTLKVEGGYVDARLAGDTARIVSSSYPVYPFEAAARQGKAKVIPSTTLTDHEAGTSEKRRLIPCRDLRRPRSFSGLEMLSLLTIDLSRGLEPTDVDSIMTHGETVYGSAEGIYVATEQWLPPDPSERQASGVTTAIHKFAIDSPTSPATPRAARCPDSC